MSEGISDLAGNLPVNASHATFLAHRSCLIIGVHVYALTSAGMVLPFVVVLAASGPEEAFDELSRLEALFLLADKAFEWGGGGSSFSKSSVGLGLRRLWGRVINSPSALVVTGVGGSTEIRLRSRVSSALILGEKEAPSGETPSGRLLPD